MRSNAMSNLFTNKITTGITWILLGLVAVCVIASISIPNLLRSRLAADQAHYYAMRQEAVPATANQFARGTASEPLGAPLPTDFRKVIQTGTMELTFTDPAAGLVKITTLCRSLGGYVESSNLQGQGEQASGSITLRVPASQFEEARRQVRALAKKSENEAVKTDDVTGHYVDLEASLRNFHAEEAQYLEIMRRSGTIKDTLEVAQRLAQVRGRIERTQGELNLLAHQVDMATLTITLRPEVKPVDKNVMWQPVQVITEALHDAGQDLADYASFMMVALVRLPAMLLWVFTFAAAALLGWRILRWGWRRFVPQAPAASA